MNNMNHIGITGRLVKDAELTFAKSGVPIARFTLACNRNIKKGEQWASEASFFDIKMFGALVQALHDKGRLTKGTPVGIGGWLRQERWQDRETGQNRSRIVIMGEDIEVLSWGRGDQQQEPEEIFDSADSTNLPDDDQIPF